MAARTVARCYKGRPCVRARVIGPDPQVFVQSRPRHQILWVGSPRRRYESLPIHLVTLFAYQDGPVYQYTRRLLLGVEANTVVGQEGMRTQKLTIIQ
jgi:hypothetical protein